MKLLNHKYLKLTKDDITVPGNGIQALSDC